MKQATSADQGLYSGVIRLHILHHACEEPIFGLGMIEELARHGYRLSPGTLYPIVHGMEKNGCFARNSGRLTAKFGGCIPQLGMGGGLFKLPGKRSVSCLANFSMPNDVHFLLFEPSLEESFL
jgi:hypothetical protein